MHKKETYPIDARAGDYLDAWVEAYCTPQADAHGKFSELTGLSRQEAKKVAYAFMWSEKGRDVFMVKNYHRKIKETFFVYRRLAQIIGSSAPSLQDILKEMD